MKTQYLDLIGTTKKDLVSKMGDEFNFYPDNIWIYLLDKNFMGRKTFLIVSFEKEIIIDVKIKKTFGNIK